MLCLNLMHPFLLQSQDRLIFKNHEIRDVENLENDQILVLAKPINAQLSPTNRMLFILDEDGKKLDSTEIVLENYDLTNINDIIVTTVPEFIYLIGVCTDIANQNFTIVIKMNIPLEMVDYKLIATTKRDAYDSKAFLTEDQLHIIFLQYGFMPSPFISEIYDIGLDSLSIEYFTFPRNQLKSLIRLEDSVYTLIVDRRNYIYDFKTNQIDTIFYDAENFIIGGPVDVYKNQISDKLMLYTTIAYKKGIHVGFNNGFTDNYSGVLYQMKDNYQVDKFLRIGTVFEFPAPTQGMDVHDNGEVFLGSLSQASFVSENSAQSRKYFRLAKVDHSLNLKWDLTFYPIDSLERIWLQGIKKAPGGGCFAYGNMGNNFFLNEKREGYILKVDTDGNILPFGDPSTGVDPQEYFTIKTYPMPVTYQFTIETDGPKQDMSFLLYDMTGKLLLSQKLKNQSINLIDFTSFPAGSYAYKIVDKKSIWKAEQIIKW